MQLCQYEDVCLSLVIATQLMDWLSLQASTTLKQQYVGFSALTLLFGCQKEHLACRKLSDEVLVC